MSSEHAMLPDKLELAKTKLDGQLPGPELLLGLAAADETLVADLWTANQGSEAFHSEITDLTFNDENLAELAKPAYDTQNLSRLTEYLRESGTLTLPILREEAGYHAKVDGAERNLTLLAATEIGTDGATHGDMSSMIYLRDQIQTASALMEASLYNSERYSQEGEDGKKLLLSALHLMSTDAQLRREERVIALGDQAGQADWPSISLHFRDLEGNEPNGWRNKQDSFQMLAYLTLDALEREFITTDDLEPAHKRFLGGIVPLLASVGFPRYETSGSWEEIEATRTSVMSVETALLAKIQKVPQGSEVFRFLEEGYDRARAQLADGIRVSFKEQVDCMVADGLTELGARIPFESRDYDRSSVKYREADAALAYVLRYDIPTLLAERHIPMAVAEDGGPMSAEAIEEAVTRKILSLMDPRTGGITRYESDSYQRTNFHTNMVQMIVHAIKGKVKQDAAEEHTEANLDTKQALRNQLTPDGSLAAWPHPLGQIASAKAKRSQEAQLEGDIGTAHGKKELSTLLLNTMLSTVTGPNQWHAALGEDGRYHLKQVPAHKVPECIVTYEAADGSMFRVPSPHTPLNWGTAMLFEALIMLESCVREPVAQRDCLKLGVVAASSLQLTNA